MLELELVQGLFERAGGATEVSKKKLKSEVCIHVH